MLRRSWRTLLSKISLLADPAGVAYHAVRAAIEGIVRVGGATGNWSTASNWAGGAIPDLSNVAAVTIPKGTTGATSLTSAGAMSVSGTVGSTPTTKTPGPKHATTFGKTTVGTSLNVTSTGAVMETASNILTVDGEGTTTVSNPNVTVNGVKGAKIPALVWISGPAGAGKTTLVASYLNARELKSLWYRFDGRDADPSGWACFTRAFRVGWRVGSWY